MDALTEHLSSYVAGLRYDDIPPDAVHGMKVRLVDTLGCAVAGLNGEPVAVARALAREAASTAPGRVWSTGERTTPELAAFANELMVRYLDFNDTYFAMEGGHPSDTIAATLTLADAAGVSGRDALVAMVSAYEVFCGLGEVHKPSTKFIDHSLHVALGSAAGASKVLGLDAERTAHAISIALTANLGLRIARDGKLSMWKAGSAANSAQAGVFAARLAEKGMTGPDEAFHGESGLAGGSWAHGRRCPGSAEHRTRSTRPSAASRRSRLSSTRRPLSGRRLDSGRSWETHSRRGSQWPATGRR